MIEMGLVVALGLIVTFLKVGWRQRMWMMSNPVVMDVAIFVVLTAIHWGTFSGVMVAAVGALFCSLTLAGARKLYGHIARTSRGRVYYPGYFDVSNKL